MIRAMALLSLLALLPGHAMAKTSLSPCSSVGAERSYSKIADFPDTPDFQSADGHYVDAGVICKQIRVFFLPLWNYDIRWTGYVTEDIYVPFHYAELQDLAYLAKIDLPVTPSLPFWKAMAASSHCFSAWAS